jgi:hypothetical protein
LKPQKVLLIHFDCSNAFLKNWLANLSGKANGFKEMDLLQEHQNFWAKVYLVSSCLIASMKAEFLNRLSTTPVVPIAAGLGLLWSQYPSSLSVM